MKMQRDCVTDTLLGVGSPQYQTAFSAICLKVREEPSTWLHWMVKLVEKNIQFFITTSGRLGLTNVTCQIQVDAKIYVLSDGDTPYILRQDKQCYHLISPCYLHAFMDGEAIAGWRIGKYKTEEVTLA